jgi:hypothetical protein
MLRIVLSSYCLFTSLSGRVRIYITILYNLKSITNTSDSGMPKQRGGHAPHQTYKAT